MRELATFVHETLPELDPVIAHGATDYGWRGLTQQGEVLEVKSSNGHAIAVPAEIIVSHLGHPIGRRSVHNDESIDIGAYLDHFNRAVACYKVNCLERALLESMAAVGVAATLRARFNHAMILLASGRWSEGLAAYWECEQLAPFMRPPVRAALDRGLRPWFGEDLHGKRLVVLHAHGLGDTIQMLRYLPMLRDLGAEVVVDLPPELQRLTKQWPHLADGDYFVPILHLLHFLRVTPGNVDGRPYLVAPKPEAWPRCQQFGTPERSPAARRIGLAWSIGKPSDGDYPREIPLCELVNALPGAELHSLQLQGAEDAEAFGVKVHTFRDFADCARLMMHMDAIVSVDTAAVHLAGAIGHRCVNLLLSNWASWRWLAPWYANLHICRQQRAGDWSSALAQMQLG